MSDAFAPTVRARPNPIFGRPVHQRSPHSITARYFSSNPSDSGSLRTPCPPASKPAGRRGITPAFGYSAPHPSAGGTLTLLIHALPSAHYGLIRLLIQVHARRAAYRLPEPARHTSPGMDETSQVPRKELLHVHKVSDCARFFPCKPFAMGRCCLLFNGMRSAPRN